MKIKPYNASFVGTHRTGTLNGVTKKMITTILGFKPNMENDGEKVTACWQFFADGVLCAILDYKESFKVYEASCYGPAAAFEKIFGPLYERY